MVQGGTDNLYHPVLIHFVLGFCNMAVSTRIKESGRGKSLSYSGDLRKLIEKFIKTRVSDIPANAKDPAKDIREELTSFRFDYADLDLIHRLLLHNPSIGYSHINEIFDNKGQISENLSLMNIISAAVDKILMTESERWWKQERSPSKAASVTANWYKFLGVMPFYTAKEAAVLSDVDLPYKGDRLLRETIGYIKLLQPLLQKDPNTPISSLIQKYSPDFNELELTDLMIIFSETPTLVAKSIGEHALRNWNGTIYDVLQGAMEDAVSANAQQLIKLKQEGKLKKVDDTPVSTPSKRDDVETQELPTKKQVRDDSPTNAIDEDANATVPGGPKAKKVSSVVADVIEYKGYRYTRQR